MQPIKNFADAYKALQAFVPPAGSLADNYTLDRMRRLMELLGNPQDSYKVVHVAGTSGKTSTSYFIAALLHATGKKVGLTVTPHIDEVNERVQIDLIPLHEAVFCRDLEEFLDIIQGFDLQPTYFELLVAFAYWEFARQHVDYAVIEVGLGGLLDATNIIHSPEKLCVITDIGFDHTEILGNDLASISAQKAGIIQSKNVVFTYRQSDEVMEVFRDICAEQSADLHEIVEVSTDMLGELPNFQQRNWGLAAEVYGYVIERDQLDQLSAGQQKETQMITIPARMEVMRYHGKTLVLDGAHNTQKTHTLVHAMGQMFNGQDIAVLLGLVEDKREHIVSMVSELASIATVVITTSFQAGQDIPRTALAPEFVARICQEADFGEVVSCGRLGDALELLLQRPEPVLLVTGSFYLVSATRKLLWRKQSD